MSYVFPQEYWLGGTGEGKGTGVYGVPLGGDIYGTLGTARADSFGPYESRPVTAECQGS